MSYKDIKPGKYVAKALRGAVGEAKTGTMQVGVEFEIFQDGVRETIWWIGFLSEKALPYTLKSLATVGFTGDETFGEGALDLNKQVEISVELNEYEGKTTPRVAFVNELGGGKFGGLEANEIKSKLGGIDLRKEMKATYASLGLKPAQSRMAGAGTSEVKDVPF